MQMSALEQTSENRVWPINSARVRNVAFTMRVQPHLFNLITHTIPGNKSLHAINFDTSYKELQEKSIRIYKSWRCKRFPGVKNMERYL